jgi:hypothetical protein
MLENHIDDEVQRAIAFFESDRICYSLEEIPYPEAFETAIRALRQMKPVPVGDYERLIKHYQNKIRCYPGWIAEIKRQHSSAGWKQAQIDEKERQCEDDKIIIQCLEYCKERDAT